MGKVSKNANNSLNALKAGVVVSFENNLSVVGVGVDAKNASVTHLKVTVGSHNNSCALNLVFLEIQHPCMLWNGRAVAT